MNKKERARPARILGCLKKFDLIVRDIGFQVA